MCSVHMSRVDDRRTANLVGALTVAVSDRLREQQDSASAAMITLSERGQLTIEVLRRVIGLSHSATVRLVDRLADAGLVERGVGPDARSISVRLTRRGRRRAAALRAAREQLLADTLAALSGHQRTVLGQLAETLLAGLTKGRWQARFTCRFCDHSVCDSTSRCPVDRAAAVLGE
jgi:MarR family transcriptional regulator, negative regulator of the multidrug operon emrRAB